MKNFNSRIHSSSVHVHTFLNNTANHLTVDQQLLGLILRVKPWL